MRRLPPTRTRGSWSPPTPSRHLPDLREPVPVKRYLRRFAALLVAKLVSVVAAGTLRMLGYRRLGFGMVREEQARRADRGPAPGEVRLSVVIPAYGEAGRIGEVIRQIRRDLAPVGDVEVV